MRFIQMFLLPLLCGSLSASAAAPAPHAAQQLDLVAPSPSFGERARQTTRRHFATLVRDHEATLEMFDSFTALLLEGYPSQIRKQELMTILGVVVFAAHKHRFQIRKGPGHEPYIIHPIGVAKSLWIEGGVRNVDVIITALLHDTVEDTDTTLQEIEAYLGAHIAGYVAECTDDKSLPKHERKQLQIINAPHKSPEAKLVKLGDKLYNLRDLLKGAPADWSRERVYEYFVWAEQVVAGLRGTNAGLERALDEVIAAGLEQHRP